MHINQVQRVSQKKVYEKVLIPQYDHGMMKSSKITEEETKMMTMVILAVIGMAVAMVIMDLEEARSKQEVTVEKAITEQATEITKVLAQLDALAGKAGN